jgi:hypothetical protein
MNWTPVYKYLSCWSKTQVLEGLEAVIGLFDKSMLPIQEEMLQFSWMPPDYFEGVLSHVPPKLTVDIDEINLLTIRTKRKVLTVLPKVFPRTLKLIGGALRECALRRTIFAHKGIRGDGIVETRFSGNE